MKLLKLVLKILLWILIIILAIIGIRYLFAGGFSEFREQFANHNNNIWEFIKWFFKSIWQH